MESRKFEDAFKRAFEEAGVSPSENVWTNIERTLDDAESRKFAGTFQQAFGEAGVSPSENVWTNIELDLMKAEGGRLKRRLVFFQLLAAASIAFALAVAGVGYYILKDQELTGAAGQLAYQAEVNTPATATTPAGDSLQGISRGTTSAPRTGSEVQPVQPEPGASSITSVAGQQRMNSASQASPIQSETSPGVATTRPKSVSDTNLAADTNDPAGGNTQAQTAMAGTAGTNAMQGSTTQRNHTAPQRNSTTEQQAAARRDVQRRRATETAAGKTGDEQQPLAAGNAGLTSNDGQQQALVGVTGVTTTDDQVRAAATETATGGRDGDAREQSNNTGNKRNMSSDRIAQANAADAARNGAIVTGNNNAAATHGATTAPGALTTTAGQQTGYRLAYSPVPSQATPEVTSLGTRVQKPASMKVEPASTVDPLMALLARLDEQEKNANTKEKKNRRDDEEQAPEKLWTSVGFAAGSFNTINSSVSNSSGGSLMMADARKDAVDQVANQQAKASGSSYSVGVSMGTRISSRWVLQGGINYMTQASDYTASAVGTADYESFQAPSVNSIMSADKQASAELDNVVPTAPYNVNNSLQFVSVPLQAGYLLVNRKVGIQLNGGLATDLFIQNTITPDGENLEKETKGNGSNSPYRTVNFSGLMGTEFSYRFSKHYRLSLNPGVRYPLNSIYKSDQPVTAAPLTFDIGLRFRYIFH